MSPLRAARALISLGSLLLLVVGCQFHGLNSLPLPGAVGRGNGARLYHVQISNVGSLESNSPVLMDDVVVGSVAEITVTDWQVNVDVSVRPNVTVPANAVARVGQTSLLGSMHLSLDVPIGQTPSGALRPGSTIALDHTSTYPSTEQTLSSLSVLLNAGGLGQIGDVIHSFNLALSGRQDQARDLLGRFNKFVGVFDGQRDHVIGTATELNRLSGVIARQRDEISTALKVVPPALDVLNQQRPQIITALDSLRQFSDTTTSLVHETQHDLVTNLKNLDPTVRALADVGAEIDTALAFFPVLPFGQNVIDRGIRGDYMNLFVIADITTNRLKRTLASGTRWSNPYVPLVPAPGDLGFDSYYSHDPLHAPIGAPPPAGGLPAPAPPAAAGPAPGQTGGR